MWWFKQCDHPECPFWMGDNICELVIDEEKAAQFECPQEIIEDDCEWEDDYSDANIDTTPDEWDDY